MLLSILTDGLGHLSFEEMLDTAQALDVKGLEIACGGWSAAPHIDADLLLKDAGERKKYLKKIDEHGLEICALNASGNPLCPGELGEKHAADVEKTIRLAGELGVTSVVLQSGTPGATEHDEYPMWITCPFPTTLIDVLEHQWVDIGIPYWSKVAELAKSCGVEKIAFENFGMNLCYNVDTLLRMRREVGPIIGMNLDPSHMFHMNAEPIAAARALGLEHAVHHVHAKDTRFNPEMANVNGTNFLTDFFDVPLHLRSWNYVAVGYGHDELWWRRFFATLSNLGYDGPVSLEIEDATMDAVSAHEQSIKVLKNSMPQKRESSEIFDKANFG